MLNLKNTLDGYLKNVEVIGNTVQDTNNLADIRSVGDKVEGQELYKIPVVSCGENFYNGSINKGKVWNIFTPGHKLTTSSLVDSSAYNATDIFVIKPNTTFTGHINGKLLQGNIKFYDKNQCYLKDVFELPATSPTDAHYCTIHYVSSLYSDVDNIQLEYGTQATPYEPYQEQKLEILSPVQLEKVKGVADRIICKDGVWGIEKNIKTIVLDGSERWGGNGASNSSMRFSMVRDNNANYDLVPSTDAILSDMYVKRNIDWNNDIEGIENGANDLSIRVSRTRLSTHDVTGFKEWLKTNNTLVKYQTQTPQFIPLPQDQQVKLRTFVGQTNVFFTTEIAGQIKAQVPKSLGATVNTHTEQIAELHNSLERVKKLEETTISTVETESNFTTVDATSNGYFEDVKLEGKTLVNLIQGFTPSSFIFKNYNISCVAPNTEYTIIMDVDIPGMVYAGFLNKDSLDWDVPSKHISQSGLYISTITTGDNTNIQFRVTGLVKEVKLKSLVLLEGDHTNNPPSYFEGLMSVGQDVEEVSVESVNENLFSSSLYKGVLSTGTGAESSGTRYAISGYFICPYDNIYFGGGNVNQRVILHYDKNKNYIGFTLVNSNSYYTLPANSYYARIRLDINGTEIFDIDDTLKINLSRNNTEYIPHQSNKKPLLYYNPTTETWENPVLREWDTIEKHSDGKYYYHKRSGEVVLNGSESWLLNTTTPTTVSFRYSYNINMVQNLICDRFIHDKASSGNQIEGILISKVNTPNEFSIEVLKTRLSTQDVQGFKQWLQANPTTVVYQLAQEEVYECTNIDLMAYSGETNYIINSGAISPKSLLKVHNNISNVVKILQEKVSLLENTFIAGLKSVLSGDMYSLATLLYPEDFEQNDNIEQDIMVIPE